MEYIMNIVKYLNDILIVILLLIGIYFIVNIGNSYVGNKKKLSISKKQSILIALILLSIYLINKMIVNTDILGELAFIILFSIIFSYVLNPLVNKMEKQGIKRVWGVLITYVSIVLVLVLIFISIFPAIVQEFKKLAELMPSYFKEINIAFNNIYRLYSDNINNLPAGFEGIKTSFDDSLGNIQSVLISAVENITTTIVGIFSKTFSLLLIPILSFYFIKDKELFKQKLYLMIPKNYRQDIIRIAKDVDLVLGKFIRGQLIVAFFVGLATAIGLLILGIDFSLIIGIIAGIANVIPYFGPIMGIIPAVMFAFLEDPSKIIWVIVVFIVIQQIEGNILSPKIVGESVGLHPVVVIVSLLIGGSLMGILGMLLAVPVVAVLRILFNFSIEKLTE